MSFSTMLAQVVKPGTLTESRRGVMNEQQIDARRKTMRAKRNAKWKAAFDKFGGTAGTNQIGSVLGFPGSTVSSMLRRMSEEMPPMVEKVGELDVNSNGRKQHVWKWIGS